MPQAGASAALDDSERVTLEHKLRQLPLEERRLAELVSLRKKVANKEASVMKMRQQQQQQQAATQQQQPKRAQHIANTGLSSGDQRQPQNMTAAPALSSLLGPGTTLSQPGHALPWQLPPQTVPVMSVADGNQQRSLHDQFLVRSDQHANMFLALAAVPLGEKVLRIVDFISSLVPKETEQTICYMGGSR